ncbi:DeoR family transcriptional regulator [Salinisphaera sp. S4-8]
MRVLPAKRQAKIIEHLRKERFGSLPDLADLVDVSVSTVRRDVDLLCEQGHLYRTHGGAALRDKEGTTIEPMPEISSEIARAAKERIGRNAAAMIEPGHRVIFDSGSTTMEVARAALERGIAFTAITNDVAIAAVLARSSVVDVHVPGGQLRPRSATLLGSVCLKALARLNVDLAFVGAHAVSAEGASETSTEHGAIKRVILEAADRSVLVVDSGKFPGRSLCLFAGLEDFSVILTDDGLDNDLAAALEGRAIQLDVLS